MKASRSGQSLTAVDFVAPNVIAFLVVTKRLSVIALVGEESNGQNHVELFALRKLAT